MTQVENMLLYLLNVKEQEYNEQVFVSMYPNRQVKERVTRKRECIFLIRRLSGVYTNLYLF